MSEQDGDFADYLNYRLGLKPEQVQMVLQEDEWIRQQSPDEKTWYQDIKDRSSGRTGHATNLMSDMKPMRALTIPRFASFTFKVPRGDSKNLSKDEKTFLYTVMGLTGYADSVPEAIDRKIDEIMNDGNHSWRRLGAALNKVAYEGILPTKEGVEGLNQNNPAYITVKMLEDSNAVKEGLHSLEALRALDNYLKAKENPQINEFSTKLMGEIDAAQSGPTIQASMIGNWHGLYAGGLPMSEVWWKKREDGDSRFALPKLYASTAQITQGKIETIIRADEDKDFVQFVKFLFGDEHHNLDRLWNNSIGFAKTGLVGASYGQGKTGSVISISEEIKKYFEENLSPQETNAMLERINAHDSFKGEVTIDSNSYRLVFSNNAYMQLNKLAELYTTSMYESDNNIYEYSKNMRKAFKTSVLFADFAQKDRKFAQAEGRSPYIDFKPPQMIYREPQNLDSVYTKPWVDGMTKSMLDEHIPDKWKKLNFLDTEIAYQTGTPQPNIDREMVAMDFDNDEGIRSKSISRMPVVSIHGLDDLIQAITVNELYKKYGPNGTVDPGSFNYFVSVWDAGIIEPHMRVRYMEEYNKAFAKVMKENKFFSQLTRGWEDSIRGIIADDISNPDHRNAFKTLKNSINRMREKTNEIYKGSGSYVSEDKKRGIKEADKAMEERSIFQTYVPEAYDELLAGIRSASTSPSALNQGIPLDSKSIFSDFLANRN
jgi:hypothetical protein